MPANILNLSAYTVTDIQEVEHDYHVYVIANHPPNICKHCHHSRLEGFGRHKQVIKDLPMHGKRVGMYIDTRRYRCKNCNKTFYEALPDINEKRCMTNRLVNWIGKQAINRTFASIADEVGIVEGTVRKVFSDYVSSIAQQVRFETPQWMGIDEIHLIKPRCVIANIENNTLVEILHNRNKETVIKYLSGIPNKERIQYVAMDMWQPYRDAVQLVLPNAKIVIDKFHVNRMANDAMEKVRKKLREDLTPRQRRGLMHDRFVLLKREHDLTHAQAFNLDGWLKNYPILGKAYRLKEDFYGIYEQSRSPEDAIQRFEAWQQQVTPDVHEAYADLIHAWKNWQPWIIEYFNHPVTNAYTESLNNLIRIMDRLGRGYSFEVLRAKLLFAQGSYKTEKRPKFKKRRQGESGNFMGKFVAGMQFETEPTVYEEINFGPSISILIRMIENGEL